MGESNAIPQSQDLSRSREEEEKLSQRMYLDKESIAMTAQRHPH